MQSLSFYRISGNAASHSIALRAILESKALAGAMIAYCAKIVNCGEIAIIKGAEIDTFSVKWSNLTTYINMDNLRQRLLPAEEHSLAELPEHNPEEEPEADSPVAQLAAVLLPAS